MEIVIGLVVLAVGGFVVGRFIVVPTLSPRPDNLGVTNGQLATCPRTPNCVSSQIDTASSKAMSPMTFNGSVADAKAEVVRIVEAMPRSTIVTNDDDYLHVEFRSAMWNFVDDTEFYFDADNNVIHYRSAARLGRGDGGVNKARMKGIAAQHTASSTTN